MLVKGDGKILNHLPQGDLDHCEVLLFFQQGRSKQFFTGLAGGVAFPHPPTPRPQYSPSQAFPVYTRVLRYAIDVDNTQHVPHVPRPPVHCARARTRHVIPRRACSENWSGQNRTSRTACYGPVQFHSAHTQLELDSSSFF